MRKGELTYLIVLIVLIAMHTLMSFPFFIETGNLLLGPYSWVISVYLLAAVVMYFVKTMGYIKSYYLNFHLMSVLAMLLSVVPIFSALLHVLAAIVGGRVLLHQIKRVQELYTGLNIKDAREKERLKYGTEDILDEEDEAQQDIKEFLEKDIQKYKDEYQGFTERMDDNTLKSKAIESETLYVSEDLNDTNAMDQERIVDLVTLYGESALNKLNEQQRKLYDDWLIDNDDTDDFDDSAIIYIEDPPVVYSDFSDEEALDDMDIDDLLNMDINDLI